MYILAKELFFPPAELAGDDGLLATGGDLSPERLLLAYRSGIFPWYNENEPICWYSPDPRFVLFPADLRISKSMERVIQKEIFSFTIDKAFGQVIKSCSTAYRKNQEGTWISEDIIEAYSLLHRQGYAHSAEAWYNGELAGGLYGIRMGSVFCGESMFSSRTDASKFAFIHYVQYLQKQAVELIDCQVYTAHLESLGAKVIRRDQFLRLLSALTG